MSARESSTDLRYPVPRLRSAVLPAAIVLLGGFLRLFLLRDQVPVDDEWHGMYYAIGKTAAHLLTHFSIPGATCIPMNVYRWALLRTVGWSETLLHLPSLAAGLLALILFPLLARRALGRRGALAFAALLAVSPFLVFYSRMSRPYSMVALTAFAAIMAFARWMETGKPAAGVVYVLCAASAVCFHLFAIPAVCAPPAVAVLARLARKRGGTATAAGPRLTHVALATAAVAALSGLLVGPAFLDSLRSTFSAVARQGGLAWSSATGFAAMLAGVASPVLVALFWLLLAAGAVAMARRATFLGLVLIALFPLYMAAFLLSRPHSIHSPIVISRYAVVLYPAALLLVAAGGDWLVSRAARLWQGRGSPRPDDLGTLLTLAFPAVLLLGGPLVRLYAPPNNFTNHSAFQQSYRPADWLDSFASDMTPPDFTVDTTVGSEEVSPFYKALAKRRDAACLIEYPMLIGDHFNPLYFYQHVHRKRVIVGYVTDMALPHGLARGNIFGNTYVDQVLSLVPDKGKLKFRNMLDLRNLAAVKRSGAAYLVLHKRFEAQLAHVAPAPPSLGELYELYSGAFGAPEFEDAHLAAFRLWH